MQKFTNPNVKKEQNKNIRNLVIGIILIVISLLFKYQEGVEIDKASKEMTDLNSIIVSEGDKDGKMAYLDAMSIPYMFAGYDDTTDSYYMVFDDKYLYVVYMSESDFEELNTESIYDTAIRIEGITKSTPSDVKEIAIEVYNESMENEEDKLTLADFDSYFGSVYLDMTVSSPDSASTPLAFFFLFFIFGIIISSDIISFFYIIGCKCHYTIIIIKTINR